jgi:uncharacterized repeat protein (TIGR02543 family)
VTFVATTSGWFLFAFFPVFSLSLDKLPRLKHSFFMQGLQRSTNDFVFSSQIKSMQKTQKYENAYRNVVILLLLFFLGIGSLYGQQIIEVANPGEHQDIRPNLEAAWDRASAGDIIQLPAGSFSFSGNILLPAYQKPGIHLRGRGSGANGTRLYRNSETAEWMITVYGTGGGVSEAEIEISDIWFQAMDTRLYSGDGGTSYGSFQGLGLRGTDFYLHDCKFQYFSNRAVGVSHLQNRGKGVISNNEFLDNIALESDGGYSKAYGINISVWGDVTSWVSVSPGTDNFVYVEDNYFSRMAPAIAGSEGALYVFRYNTTELFVTEDSHVDLHGGRPEHLNPDYQYASRFAEVYGNTFRATPESDPLYIQPQTRALNFKGGEAIVFNNTFEGFSGYVIGLLNTGAWYDDYFDHPADYDIPDYPIPYQIGYESGDQYGTGHSGTDPDTYGDGDVFIWNNEYVDCGQVLYTPTFTYDGVTYDYIQEGRDFHRTARPDYTPYTYPHPRRNMDSRYSVSLSADPSEGGDVTGGGTYESGTEVTVRASSADGYTFEGWTSGGDTLSTSSSYSFTVNANVSLTAHFEAESRDYTVSVSSSPSSGGSVSGDGTYTEGSEVTVDATAASGYTFEGWLSSGDTVSVDPGYTFTLTQDTSLTAHFESEPSDYTVSVSSSPSSGGSVSGGGTYTEGSEVTVDATAASGYIFEGWLSSGDTVSVDPGYTFTLTQDTSLTAHFDSPNHYDVQLSANPVEGGTTMGAGTYEEGTQVTVQANAESGFEFGGWTSGGDTLSFDPTYSFTITRDTSLMAYFERQYDFVVEVTPNPSEGGDIEGGQNSKGGTIESGLNYEAGTQATLYALPSEDYVFEVWTAAGDTLTTDSIVSFDVTEDMALTAHFAQLHDVTLQVSPPEGGRVDGGGSYEEGSEVVLRAEPAEGYHFEGWTLEGDTLSADTAFTFEVNNDMSITANFQQLATGLDDAERDPVRIFPNPVVNILYVQGLENTYYQLTIYDIKGRKVKHKQIQGERVSVPVDDLAPGMYILRIDNGQTNLSHKLIVQ